MGWGRAPLGGGLARTAAPCCPPGASHTAARVSPGRPRAREGLGGRCQSGSLGLRGQGRAGGGRQCSGGQAHPHHGLRGALSCTHSLSEPTSFRRRAAAASQSTGTRTEVQWDFSPSPGCGPSGQSSRKTRGAWGQEVRPGQPLLLVPAEGSPRPSPAGTSLAPESPSGTRPPLLGGAVLRDRRGLSWSPRWILVQVPSLPPTLAPVCSPAPLRWAETRGPRPGPP